MLSFAAVGLHGRGWGRRIAACALLLAMESILSADFRRSQVAASPDIALAIHTLIARREAMLDVVEAGDALVVLGSESIALYRRDDAIRGATAVARAAVAHVRPWPRDLRGALSVDGPRFEAFLPGVVCRGVVQPLSASCVDQNARWPLDLENEGVMPSRNHFTTPEGLAFYNAASLSPMTSPRWVVADVTGALAFLDASRRFISRGEAADDVARLESTCMGGVPILVTVGAGPSAGRDEIRLRIGTGMGLVERDRLTLSGAVTALWAKPGSPLATAVVRDVDGNRYEAHQISVACAR